MKFKTALLTAVVALSILPTGRSNDISVDSGKFSFYGTSRRYSTADYSEMYRSGLGSGYYQPGYVHGVIANNDDNRSGTIVGNIWISSYVGASTGRVAFSVGWGGGYRHTFNAGTTWTCTKNGYRKKVYKYGIPSLAAHEYSGGGWPMRDELYFSKAGSW